MGMVVGGWGGSNQIARQSKGGTLMARRNNGPRDRTLKEKISVTVDRDVWERARTLPWASSASDVVNEALHRLVAAERLGVMLDRLTDDFGTVDERLVAEAEAKWFGA
jgi:hypothetical protein